MENRHIQKCPACSMDFDKHPDEYTFYSIVDSFSVCGKHRIYKIKNLHRCNKCGSNWVGYLDWKWIRNKSNILIPIQELVR